jgi:xanthine dehydrogenase accessory factor
LKKSNSCPFLVGVLISKIRNMNNIYLLIPDKITASVKLAVATVIETRGSTPQKHGSSALFGKEGLLAGTVGGGVLEGKVQQIARETITSNKSGIFHFNFDNDISAKNDAICGGEATILIDALPSDHKAVFDLIKQSLLKRIPGVLVTMISGSSESDVKIIRELITSSSENNIPERYSALLTREIESLLSAPDTDSFKKFELTPVGDEKVSFVLLEALFPEPKLIIAGAGHIGRALAHLGKLLSFEVTIADDRAEYANKTNIPDADHLIVGDIGETMNRLSKDADTYIVIVTRGHDDDAKALKHCIDCGAAYVGMIGSKKKIAKMHRNFVENGLATEKQWSEIHAPVGIDINSKTVEEIAVSIAAELVLERNRKKFSPPAP